MTKKIFKSIMVAAGAVLLASLVIILGCLYHYFSDIQMKQLEDELSLAVIAVESNGQKYLEKLQPSQYRLTWVAENGDVLYDTQSDSAKMENHADREEIRQASQSREGKSSRYSTTLLEKTLYCARRLEDGSVLRISVRSVTLWVLVFGMMQPIAIVLAVALVLSGVLASRISKHIMEPLNSLDLEKPLDNDTYEELAPLLSRINKQHRQIDRQLTELQRKNDEFAQITCGMTEGLVLLNEKNIILNINPAALKLFHTEESCVGRDFLTVERSHDVSRAIQDAFLNGHSEIRLEREGKEYQLHINRIESNGSMIGAVVLVFDITEAAFAERNRREFTANVSHELKTPLQSIMGSAEIMENGLVKSEDMARFVGHIRTEAGRLVTLIDDIIRLSRLDEGCDMPFETVDLYEVASDVTADLADIATAKNIEMILTGETVMIMSIRRLLTEIIFNLCDNAIKYNKDSGTVEVSVSRQENCAVVTVKDSGIGIPPEHQTRIFERFYRVDKSRSKESGGTGLGLSIVKHAVQYLNGRIDLQSSPGEGTVVQIAFPETKEEPVSMIRKFEAKDTERVMQIWLDANLETHDFIPGDYWQSHFLPVQQQLLQADIYVYERDGEIQGFAGMTGDYLAGIFVDKKYRSTGIGKSLLACVKKNYPAFSLNVYQRNRRATDFYLREGLSVVSEGMDEETSETEYTMSWNREEG